MIRVINYVLFFTFFLIISSCKFDLFEAYEYTVPSINIQSIEQINDTTYVEVEVINNGEAIEFLGIAYNIDTPPAVTTNQLLFSAEEGLVRLALPNLRPEKNYYFKALAGNAFALAESEVLSFRIPIRAAPIIPCEVSENKIRLNGTHTITRVSTRELDTRRYEVNASNFGLEITLTFSEPPTSGIYTTTTEMFPTEEEVQIDVDFGQSRIVRSGGKVYVEKRGVEAYDISFCDLLVLNITTESEMRGNIVVN